MLSKQFNPPLPDVVPERDSRVVRCYAEHLEGLGLSDRMTGELTSTARHIAVWLALNGPGLDTFDIRLLDRFMRHECHCPGRRRTGRRPGRQCRQFAVRFLRYLLETGRAEVPAEIEATRDIRKVSLWLGHQSLKTTEIYLRTDPAAKLGILSEWRSPGLAKGRFTGVKDALMAMLSDI